MERHVIITEDSARAERFISKILLPGKSIQKVNIDDVKLPIKLEAEVLVVNCADHAENYCLKIQEIDNDENIPEIIFISQGLKGVPMPTRPGITGTDMIIALKEGTFWEMSLPSKARFLAANYSDISSILRQIEDRAKDGYYNLNLSRLCKRDFDELEGYGYKIELNVGRYNDSYTIS